MNTPAAAGPATNEPVIGPAPELFTDLPPADGARLRLPLLPEFTPPAFLRSGMSQTLAGVLRPMPPSLRAAAKAFDAAVQHLVVPVRHDARLKARFAPARGHRPNPALAVLIHGWEGTPDSPYLRHAAAALHEAGHAVYCLVLRDHDASHALNREPFHSARFGEVLDSIRHATTLAPGLPLMVAGWSLGGNFALRAAIHGPKEGLAPDLCVGVSPAVDPYAVLRAVDSGPKLVLKAMHKSWIMDLRDKERAWPGVHNFAGLEDAPGFTEATRQYVERFTEYPSLADYLSVYTLTPDVLARAPGAVAVLAAADDSVVPPAMFHGLAPGGAVAAVEMVPHGGHCGFVDRLLGPGLAERVLVAWAGRVADFDRDVESSGDGG